MRQGSEHVSRSSGQPRRLLTTTVLPLSQMSGHLEFSWQRLSRSAVFLIQVIRTCLHDSVLVVSYCEMIHTWQVLWISVTGDMKLCHKVLLLTASVSNTIGWDRFNTLTASTILGQTRLPLLNPKSQLSKNKCICNLSRLSYFHSPGGSMCTISLRRGRQL